ncbi:MAG: tRNA-dihydrouridine synthase [Fidelibacterota bacterium]
MEFGVDCDMTLALTGDLRKRTAKLLIMKLSPNVTDIGEIARAAEDGGADAVSAINTVTAMSVSPETRRPHISTKIGGLSGPAIRPIGIASVYKISQAVNIPVIGIGGITSGSDAVEYLLVGATAVEVGTANFRDPAIGLNILDELEAYCRLHDISELSSLVGGIEDDA